MAKGTTYATRELQRKRALEKLKDPTHIWPDFSRNGPPLLKR